jgi:WD40 repeat protein
VDWAKSGRRRNLLWGDPRLALVAQLRRRPAGDPARTRDIQPSLARRILEYFIPAQLVAGLEPDWLTGVERAFVLASAGRRRTTSLVLASIPLVAVAIVAVLIAASNAREQRSAAAEVNELAAAAGLVRSNPEEIVNAAPRALAAYADRQQHYGRHPPGVLGPLSEIAEHRNSLPIGSASVPGGITDLRVDDRGMSAVLDGGHGMELWRLDREGKSHETPLKSAPSSSCDGRFSPDGRRIACVITDAVQTWDTATGTSSSLIAAPSATGAPVFSARGTWIAAFLNDSGQYVWNPVEDETTEDRPPPLPEYDSGQTQVVTLSPDGRWMATGRADHRVQLWSPEGALAGELGEHRDVVTSAAFDPRGERVVSGGLDRLCRLWVVGRSPDRSFGPTVLAGSRSAIEIVHFTSNGRGVVAHANGSSRPVDLWSTEPTGIRLDLPHSGELTMAMYSPDGERILTGSRDLMVRVWDARTGQLRKQYPYPTRSTAAAFGPDGTWFVEALYSGESPIARLWTEAKDTPIELSGHRMPIVVIKVSHDGQQIATASEDGTVRIWDPSGTYLGSLEHSPMTSSKRQLHLEGVLDVDWSHDDQLLVTAGADGQAKVWDAKSRALITSLIGHTGAVTSASFSADGAYVLTSGRDGSARLWQAPPAGGKGSASPRSEAPISSLLGHTGAVTRSRFSPTSEFAVTAGDDGSVRVWQVPSGRLVHVLEGHTKPVLDIAISPSGEQIASGGQDWTVRLWNLQQGTLDAVFEDHSGPVVSVGYRSDGRRVVSAGKDSYARVFPTSAEEPLDRLCEVLVEAPDASSEAQRAAAAFCAARHREYPRDFVAAWRRLYP